MHLLKTSADLTPLLNDIGEKKVVMLGEASHGTHEYYTWRTAISKRLIEEKGFSFIAVEGDWPDCYKINRYVKSYKDAGHSIKDILKTFDRWPTWMWANWEVAALADWLKGHNAKLPMEQRIGFYGLDVYSLWESLETVLKYLEKEDPQTAKSVRQAIQCFEPYEQEAQLYARASISESCRQEVLKMLREVRLTVHSSDDDPEHLFDAEQNALIAVHAEKYYSSMIGFDNESWNIRDTHMMETLDRLLQLHGKGAKGIVWEHNSHIGDARATDMHRAGLVNIGQLAREQYGINKVYLAGFGSYQGSVIAGREWGAPMKKTEVPKAKQGSIEQLLHEEANQDCYYLFSDETITSRFNFPVPHRAIGVVYNPDQERFGNYVPSILPKRYDAFIYLDNTKALHPLHLHPDIEKIPETYPFGF